MNNVNDLNRTQHVENIAKSTPTNQTISLSALKPEEASEISINTTDGLTGISEEVATAARPSISINPRRKLHHRSSEEAESLKEVDPNEYFEKPETAPQTVDPRDKAMGLLDAAVKRKKEEFRNFIEAANESDKANRELVEAGLEEIEGEVQYLPDTVYSSDEEEKINKALSSKKHNMKDDDYDDFDDDFDSDDEEKDEESFNEINTKAVIKNDSFFDDDEEDAEFDDEKEEDDMSFDDNEKLLGDEEETTSFNDEDLSNSEEENTIEDSKEITVEQESTNTSEDNNIFATSINVTSSAFENPINEASTNDFELDEKDLEGVTAPVDEVLSDEEVKKISKASEKHLKSEILQKIVQTGKTMDTSQFVVSNKVINIKDIKEVSKNKVERTVTWPLMYAGRPYKASALKGPEIAMLADADNSESNEGSALTLEQAQIIFEHDANPYRPSTIEAWAKTIPYSDIENIFAALYMASLKGANYIPMACPKNSCQYAYLTENIEMKDIIKFPNDEIKKKFNEIKSMELTPENTGSYESVVSVINDKFAIGIKIPSIFTILYEYNSLTEEFIRKYTAIVSIIQYIDYIYYIDPETSQFQPIGWKTYPGDNGKSFKSKIATYAKIIKELDDTDFTVMIALITSMINKMVEMRGIRYELPAQKCPKCGATIAAREINARGLVFMRQRLVELATTPSEK